jgi:hypothetical protein
MYVYIGCSFKFILKVGVDESIVNAPRIQITDQLFKSNLTFCGVCGFSVQTLTDESCVHNRPFNANFEEKFKRTVDIHIANCFVHSLISM